MDIKTQVTWQVINPLTYTFHRLVVNHKTKCETPFWNIGFAPGVEIAFLVSASP